MGWMIRKVPNEDTGKIKDSFCYYQLSFQQSRPFFHSKALFSWLKTKVQLNCFEAIQHSRMLLILPLHHFEIYRIGIHAKVARYDYVNHLMSFSNAKFMKNSLIKWWLLCCGLKLLLCWLQLKLYVVNMMIEVIKLSSSFLQLLIFSG